MSVEALDAHLATGVTGVARCWRLTRRDGVVHGFTDHDRDLGFDGTIFLAGTGLSAAALSQSTGLAVDNSEAVGALSDVSVTEADIVAGRFDGAEVEAWLVEWANPENRVMQFRGSIGEISRSGGGRSRPSFAALPKCSMSPWGGSISAAAPPSSGDAACGVDLTLPDYAFDVAVSSVAEGRVFVFEGVPAYEARWFERGGLRMLDGKASGLAGAIKSDRPQHDGSRRIELWDRLRAEVEPGNMVRLTAGCDKRMETCRLKFSNILNFRGFPDIPGEDWLVAHPTRVSARDGGSRR